MSNELAKIESFRYQIAIAETVEEFKHLIKDSDSIAAFAKKQKISKERQDDIGVMRIELDSAWGAFLKKNYPKGAPKENRNASKNKVTKSVTLKMPATPKESARARLLDETPQEVKDEVISEIKESSKVVTPDLIAETIKKKKNMDVRKKREVEEVKKNSTKIPIIIHSDCMAIIDNINPIDLLIADPPYFTDGNFTSQISAYLKKVKPTGQAYIFMGADPKEISSFINNDSGHMILEQVLIWNYNNTGQRQPNNRYTSNYQIALYYRGPDAPGLNKPADGKEQYACQTINAPDARIGDRYHSWQKPDELIMRLIRNSSKENDFIFDPFAGTGSTLVNAGILGREAIGCDIDESCIKICLERGCKRGI